MDPILQVIFSWQLIIYGLAIATIIYVMRTFVEYFAATFHKDLSKNNLWNNLILPMTPIFLGAISAAKIQKFPYPGFIPDANGNIARGDRIIFGLVAGLLSGLLYKVVKGLLTQKIASTEPNYQQPYYPYTQPYYQQQPPQQQTVIQMPTMQPVGQPTTTQPTIQINTNTGDVSQADLPNRGKL